jgi:hypothetical protein
VDQAAKELGVHRHKWGLLAEWDAAQEQWMMGPIADLSPEDVQAKARLFSGGPPFCLDGGHARRHTRFAKLSLPLMRIKLSTASCLVVFIHLASYSAPHSLLWAQVDDITRANYKMLKSRKDDMVVARLKARLDAFSNVMPVLTEVRVLRCCCRVI